MICPYCGQDTIRWDEEQNCWRCPWCGEWPDSEDGEDLRSMIEQLIEHPGMIRIVAVVIVLIGIIAKIAIDRIRNCGS